MRGFGELETVIMARVWQHGRPVTVRELFDELAGERAIAYTTVMTTMDNLHRKGWLTRVKEGKAYRYTATASREEYSARLMREALDGGGDTQAVLSHFVAQMDGEESELLRAVVRKLAERFPEREAGVAREREPAQERGAAGPETGAG
jgi:predicted transcriptional regulator